MKASLVESLVVASAVAVGALLALAVLWRFQDRLVYFPPPLESTAHLPRTAVALEVEAGDGTRLRGWIVPAGTAPSPVVLYFGGNAEEVSWTLADPRWPRGWAIASLNYRGFGASEGKPGERELAADALVVYDALARRADVDPRRIVVFGRSLGSALAARVAAERPVAGAILVSPFDSLVRVGQGHYPWLPVSLMLRHRFDAAGDARRAGVPLLAIVGGADTLVPPARSRALYEAWAGPKAWLELAGADHVSVGEAAAYWEGVARFLAQR